MLPYTVIRSARRTIGLEIRQDLSLLVRAPLFVSQRKIEQTVQAHRMWIDKTVQKMRERQQNHPPLSPEKERQLREEAKRLLPALVQRYAEQLQLFPSGVRITGARTRFGSCSGKNSLCFSFRLMEYSLPAIEYVVVHELCHIRHKNHSAAFHALVESVLPDYRARRDLLKR